jgi:DNA excision repair protein ERCC-6
MKEHVQVVTISKETEKEFLIRTGKMAPIEKTDEDEIVVNESVIADEWKLSDASSFESEKEETEVVEKKSVRDDGENRFYEERVSLWANKRKEKRIHPSSETEDWTIEKEMFLPSPKEKEGHHGILSIPGDIYGKLFEYQKTALIWLWELFKQKKGGILGDEMGLGKTIQIIAFLAALHFSRLLSGPILIVCPATVMKQWVQVIFNFYKGISQLVGSFSGDHVTLFRNSHGYQHSFSQQC